MAAERLADRRAACPTCDALVAALSALMVERPGAVPTAAELSARSAVSERELVRHVGDPVGCFVIAFERETDRVLAAVEADLHGEDASVERRETVMRAHLGALSEDRPDGAVVLGAPRLTEPRIVAAVAAWRERSAALVHPGEPDEDSERSARGSFRRPTAAAGAHHGRAC